MDVIPPVSSSSIDTIRLGGRRPRVPGTGLAVQPERRSRTMAHLGRRIIRLPPLQLLSHETLHLFPVYFVVTAQSFILNRLKDTSWKHSFQPAA